MDLMTNCTAFADGRLIARGVPGAVAAAVRRAIDEGESAPVLVFDDRDGRAVDFDLRGSPEEVASRLVPAVSPEAADEGPRGRGRPKLGVVAREVTLLPRHWDWLNGQPGGASVVLRRLVDAARSAGEAGERARLAREAAHRVMTALAGNLSGYEDALRALYGGDRARFDAASDAWPGTLRDYVRELAEAGLAAGG